MKSNKMKPVTVEDLLRFKRMEQPPQEFWIEFERELRAKQLAAIVEPRPWWAPFIRLGAKYSHFQLPVGAAAILVLSVITVREYRSSHIGSAYVSPTSVEEVSLASSDPVSGESLSAAYETSGVLAVADHLIPEESETSLPASQMPSTTTVARSVSTSTIAIEREPSPSAKYIATNLAAAQAADPRLLDEVFGSSMRQVPDRDSMRDPLTQVNAPGESRRARLLASALPVNAGVGEVTVGTSDRVARHLTEERLYDTISRVGLKADRVAIKF